MDFDLDAIAGAVVTGLIVGVGKLIQNWSRTRPTPERQARADAVILDELWSIYENLEAHSVRIVRSENSGGIPRPGYSAHTSVTHEAAAPKHRLMDRWQHQPMDRQVTDLWATCSVAKRVILHTADLPSSTQAKALYESTGVTDAIMFWLGHDKQRRYGFMLILNFNDEQAAPPDWYAPDFEEAMRQSVMVISNELTRYR